MPVRLRCPGCQTAYQLPDTVRGKTVRCKSCSKTFKVPAATAVGTKAPAAASATAAGFERRRAPDSDFKEARKKPKPPPVDDDEDIESPPRRAAKPKSSSKKKKTSPVVMIAVLAGVGAVLVGVAVAAFIMMQGTPSEPPKTLVHAGQPPAPPQQPAANQKAPGKKGKQIQDSPDDAAVVATVPPGVAVSYASHIRPLLDAYCAKCHNASQLKGGANFETHESILRGGRGGKPLLIPSDPGQSPIVLRVESKSRPMPPGKEKQPTAGERALLRRWVEAGAVDDSGHSEILLVKSHFDVRLKSLYWIGDLTPIARIWKVDSR